MISRNGRGTRRASVRARLAIAAALLAGAGAAGVVVVASHGGSTAVQSAGYSTHKISATSALSSAMNGWSKSPSRSLATLSKMTPVAAFAQMPFHHVMLAVERGTVAATAKTEFVAKSTNGKLELWHVNRGTKVLNVGGSRTGMAAMTGGTMSARGHMNPSVRTLAAGDLVFVFGVRENHTLKAELILFAAPTPKAVAPTVTPSMTATPSVAPTQTVVPAVPAVPAATGSTPPFSGQHS